MNLDKRLEVLEKRLVNEPITLVMADGSAATLRGPGDFVLDLVSRACRGDRTPETELIAQSFGSTEPGGGCLVDLARAILNSPLDQAAE